MSIQSLSSSGFLSCFLELYIIINYCYGKKRIKILNDNTKGSQKGVRIEGREGRILNDYDVLNFRPFALIFEVLHQKIG